ncbi:MAG: hypothetical protein ACTSVI_04390 [Promethearchaeota archaeon]
MIIIKLSYNITGLSQFSVSFESYCNSCEWRSRCKFGKENPLEIEISCKEIKYIEDDLQFKYVSKIQREGGDMEKAYEKKMPKSKILSQLWKEKIKAKKDEIFCLNTNNLDLIIVSNRSKDWWKEFSLIGKEIIKECSKIY